MDGAFLAFLAVSAVVIVSPGQDTALTIRNTLLGGRRGGLATALGVATGQAGWTLAASTGLAAVLAASEAVFATLRLVGAIYLCYLGLRSLRSAIRPAAGVALADGATGGRLPPRAAWRQGAMSSLGNPKLAIFFSGLLPPFVPAGAPAFPAMLGLGAVFIGLTVAWLSLYAVAIARAGDLLRRGRARRALDAATGTVLVALGLRLAAEPSAS